MPLVAFNESVKKHNWYSWYEMVLPERVATWSDKNLEKCWSIGSPELCANVETKFKASAKANVTRVNITEANTQLLFMHCPALTPLITGRSFRIYPRICLLKWRPPINFFFEKSLCLHSQ